MEDKGVIGRIGGVARRALGGLSWDPSLHPRDDQGRFVDTPDVTFGGGKRGRAISQVGDTVTVETADGGTVKVPARDVRDASVSEPAADVLDRMTGTSDTVSPDAVDLGADTDVSLDSEADIAADEQQMAALEERLAAERALRARRGQPQTVDFRDLPTIPGTNRRGLGPAEPDEGGNWLTRYRAGRAKRAEEAAKRAEEARHAGLVARRREEMLEQATVQLGSIPRDGRPDATGGLADPIDCGDDVVQAATLLAEGKHVRLNQAIQVTALLEEIRGVVDDAKAKWGDKDFKDHMPEYDLCKVHVPQTNLFCEQSKGIPRTRMPQLKGEAVEGSYAALKGGKVGKDGKVEADVEPEFADLLVRMGIPVTEETWPASHLRASQENLDGAKVAGMSKAMREGKVPDAPIYITRDGYILDGHHRWASKVAIDLEDGVPGDIDMPVHVVDADIGYIIDLTNGFTAVAGIKAKGMGAAAESVK